MSHLLTWIAYIFLVGLAGVALTCLTQIHLPRTRTKTVVSPQPLGEYASTYDPRRGRSLVLWASWCYWCGVALTTPIDPNPYSPSYVESFNTDAVGRRCAVALDGKWYCKACVTAARELLDIAR